jgi:hypothetical protein
MNIEQQVAGLVAGASLEALMKALVESPQLPGDPRMPEALAKSTFTQSGSATTGLTFYDLEAGAKFLYPVLTPLRNEIPRVSGKGGIQANWKAVTGINTSGIRVGVSVGNRGAVAAVSTADYNAAYKGIGIEDNVDFEAQYAGEGFADIRAIAAKVGLEMLMLGEEILLLGGNGTLGLGTTPTPAAVGSITGGTLAAATYNVVCVALTLEGFLNASVTGGIPTSIVRTNADGSVDTFGGGSAQKSATTTGVVASGSTGSITATVTTVRGAVAYAWVWGTAGNEKLGAITTVNAVTITATAVGTQTLASLPAADNSTNGLVFDGLLTQAQRSGSNSYYRSLDGANLTGDGAGGIVEIDTALKAFWDTYRLSPDTIWISSDLATVLSKKILAAGVVGAYRVVVDMSQGAIAGGVMVATYMNRFSMGGANILKVRIHPNMPGGLVFFTSQRLPYPVSGVGNVMQVRYRQEYYQIEWPLRSRKYEYGVYADEVLQHYFPPSMGCICNVGIG